jgi:hypothetical protein
MTAADSYEVRTAERGPHWIAWLTRPGSDKPEQSIVIVGETRAEAEANARAWITSPYNVSRPG